MVLLVFGVLVACFWPANVSAQAETILSISDHYIVTHAGIPELILQTHTVDMAIQADLPPGATPGSLSSEQIGLVVESRYRFLNESKEARSIRFSLQRAADSETKRLTSSPADVTIQIDGQLTTGQLTGSEQLVVDAQFQSEQQRSLLVSYRVSLGQAPLILVRYPVEWLRSWGNDYSLRFNLRVDEQIPNEAWTILQPDGWNYALSENVRQPDLKWLFDGQLPASPITFQFIHPLMLRELQGIQQRVTANPGAVDYLELGQRYQQLLMAAKSVPPSVQSSNGTYYQQVADRFYAQSVAAYSSGVQVGGQSNENPDVLALLHARLAAQYRSRLADSVMRNQNGRSNADGGYQYARLMIQEATNSLELLPSESPLRAELQQWQIEGTYMLYQRARNDQEWDRSLAYLNQLSDLVGPAGEHSITQQTISEQRRIIVIQQALELLEGGNEEAAVALAGDEIGAAELRPPPDQESLFSQWQITVTVDNQTTHMDLKAIPVSTRTNRATDQLKFLLNRWLASGWVIAAEQPALKNDTDASYMRTQISIPHSQPRDVLVQSLSDDVNWALLRELLGQTRPQVDSASLTLFERKRIDMVLDLRTVGDQWDLRAAQLRNQAEDAQQVAQAGSNSAGKSSIEQSNLELRSRIQAVNYANEATIWEDLADRSWVVVALQVGNSGRGQERSWLATVNMPPQRLILESSALSPVRAAGILLTTLLSLVFLSAILWWLL